MAPVLLDVTDIGSIEAAAKTVSAEVGERGLAGLVNNAGVALGGPLEFVPLDELRRQLEVNTIGPMAVTQHFLPLVRQGRGRIVFVSSIGGRFSNPIIGPYCASKFALEALADALRMELAPPGIHVSVIEPGAVKTMIFEKAGPYGDLALARLPEEGKRLYGKMGRAGSTSSRRWRGARSRQTGWRAGSSTHSPQRARGRATWSASTPGSRLCSPGCCPTARATH